MSEREQLIRLIETVPAYKIGYILAYVQGITAEDGTFSEKQPSVATADERADDDFCEQMYQNHLTDPDPEKEQTFSLADCKKEWGLA